MAMATAMIAALPPVITAPMIVATARCIANGRAGNNHAWRTDGRHDDYRRRARNDRLPDDDSRPGQRRKRGKRQADSDAYVEAGMGNRQATHENGCN